MSIFDFLRSLLFHITAAALTLFVMLLVGEKFAPGSVLPFINLVDFAFGLLALLILTAIFPQKKA